MKHIMLLCALLLSCLSLAALPEWGMIGYGYSINSQEDILMVGISLKNLTGHFGGAIYSKLISSSKGSPTGFRANIEPYGWWQPTGEEIWNQYVIHLGYMLPIKKHPWIYIAPYFGAGYYTEYKQYKSTASDMYFHYKHVKDRGDLGIDVILYNKHVGAFIGTSLRYSLQLGVMVGY